MTGFHCRRRAGVTKGPGAALCLSGKAVMAASPAAPGPAPEATMSPAWTPLHTHAPNAWIDCPRERQPGADSIPADRIRLTRLRGFAAF